MKNVMLQIKRRNACDKVKGIKKLEDLVALFFHSQGREFCEKHNYPTAKHVAHLSEDLEMLGIYVNKGEIYTSKHKTAFIGKDSKGVVVADNTNKVFNVVVIDNAHVKVIASNYAVVHFTTINNGTYEFINQDQTAIKL